MSPAGAGVIAGAAAATVSAAGVAAGAGTGAATVAGAGAGASAAAAGAGAGVEALLLASVGGGRPAACAWWFRERCRGGGEGRGACVRLRGSRSGLACPAADVKEAISRHAHSYHS